jgi:hypothetical protein
MNRNDFYLIKSGAESPIVMKMKLINKPKQHQLPNSNQLQQQQRIYLQASQTNQKHNKLQPFPLKQSACSYKTNYSSYLNPIESNHKRANLQHTKLNARPKLATSTSNYLIKYPSANKPEQERCACCSKPKPIETNLYDEILSSDYDDEYNQIDDQSEYEYLNSLHSYPRQQQQESKPSYFENRNYKKMNASLSSINSNLTSNCKKLTAKINCFKPTNPSLNNQDPSYNSSRSVNKSYFIKNRMVNDADRLAMSRNYLLTSPSVLSQCLAQPMPPQTVPPSIPASVRSASSTTRSRSSSKLNSSGSSTSSGVSISSGSSNSVSPSSSFNTPLHSIRRNKQNNSAILSYLTINDNYDAKRRYLDSIKKKLANDDSLYLDDHTHKSSTDSGVYTMNSKSKFDDYADDDTTSSNLSAYNLNDNQFNVDYELSGSSSNSSISNTSAFQTAKMEAKGQPDFDEDDLQTSPFPRVKTCLIAQIKQINVKKSPSSSSSTGSFREEPIYENLSSFNAKSTPMRKEYSVRDVLHSLKTLELNANADKQFKTVVNVKQANRLNLNDEYDLCDKEVQFYLNNLENDDMTNRNKLNKCGNENESFNNSKNNIKLVKSVSKPIALWEQLV